jgi:hypothetical protein
MARTGSDRCIRDCESGGVEDASEEKPIQIEKGKSHGGKSRGLDRP